MEAAERSDSRQLCNTPWSYLAGVTQILGAVVFASLWLLFNVVDWIPPGRVSRGVTGALLALVVGTLYLNRGAFDAGLQRIVADISKDMIEQVEKIMADSDHSAE